MKTATLDPASEKSIKEKLCELNKYLLAEKSRAEATLVNDHIAADLFRELRYGIKTRLVSIFGPENSWADWGLFKDVYSHTPRNGFTLDDGICFAHWSHKEEPVYLGRTRPSTARTGVMRENLFYKGTRWSQPLLKAEFYSTYNIVRDTIEGCVPVQYLATLATDETFSTTEKQYLRLLTGWKSHDKMPQVLRVPLRETAFASAPGGGAFLDLLDHVIDIKKTHTPGPTFGERIDNALRNIAADPYLKEQLPQWCKEFMDFFGPQKEINERAVVSFIAAMQHYDTDPAIAIHFFFPKHPAKPLRFPCLIGLVTHHEVTLCDAFIRVLVALVDTLAIVPEVEYAIWKSLQDNVVTQMQWKKQYEMSCNRYRALGHAIQGICETVCERAKITPSQVSMRVKEFDSFYTKILRSANEFKDGKYECTPNALEYRAFLLKPDEETAKKLFHKLRDMVGVRVVCVFQEDAQTLCDQIKGLAVTPHPSIAFNEDSDVKEFGGGGIDEKGEEILYRSTHITVTFGVGRAQLYEYALLKDLRCEIQIRTILAHGWADVDHDLFYKAALPEHLAKKIITDRGLQSKRRESAEFLKKIDGTFSETRKAFRTESEKYGD